MADPLLILASLAHASALLALLIFACRQMKVPVREWPFFVPLFLWVGLVLAGHLAGAVDALNSLSVYVPATFVGIGVVLVCFHAVSRLPVLAPLVPPPQLAFATIENPKVARFLKWFFLITLGLFFLISLAIAMSVYPDNADSMIYRLPRAVWYVSHGNLLHPFTSPDNRLVYYPLDGVLLYVPLVLYGLPGTFHSIPSLIAWCVVVYGAYRMARELGADKLIALFTAWLVGLTPSILAQATSTNDEIIAAAVLLCGLFMGWRWLVSGQRRYFFMAGLAVSLSAGTKLHIVFLLPIIGIAFLIALWVVAKNATVVRRWWHAIGGKTAVLTLLMMAVLFSPFLFYNYASTGRFYFFDDFKNEVFNLSASLQVGLQNLLIYVSQMTLSPLADMNFWPIANDRQRFNTALNQIFDPVIRSFLDENPNFYHLGYRFVGVTIPVSVRFVEFSLWSAFIWLLWPFQAVLALKQKFSLRPLLFLLAITPPFWLVFWSFTTLYMEGTATYFTFYLVCAVPAAAMTFAQIRRPFLNEVRWVIVALVALSNILICHNLVMYSGFRALPDLYYTKVWPYDWLLTQQPVIDEIRAASRIRVVMTHEKLPYFGYMHWNPSAVYYSPFTLSEQEPIEDLQSVLQILPISSLNMYGFMPLKIPGKATPGPTYLGAVRAIGREAIFATGNGVELRHPDDSDYIILQAQILPGPNKSWTVSLAQNPMGYAPADDLTFEYEFKAGTHTIYHRDADKNPSLNLLLKFNPQEYKLEMTTIVRSAKNGQELTRATYQVGGPGMWLPEGGEY